MQGPPAHIAARRDAQRARLRRRQRALAGLLAAVVLALAVVLLARGGSGGGHGAARAAARHHRAGGSATRTVHRGAGQFDRAAAAEVSRLARLGLPVYCAGPRGNALAFTFDDGPGPYTHYAIKKLRQAGERATFFTVGRSIDNFPGWLQRELPVGTIGDHTLTHPLLTALPAATAETQIAATARKIEAQIGQPVDLFRPPYGARNTEIDGIARKLGLLEILWNVDSADSLGANWAGIIQNVEAGMHPGSIILMHENRGQTIRALTTLLPELHRRGLRSVTVPELLRTDPPSPAQLRAGPAGCGRALLHGSGG